MALDPGIERGIESGIEPSGFFALRTPLLPFDAIVEKNSDLRAPAALDGDLDTALEADRAALTAKLRAHILDPAVREALFVASPSLSQAIAAWLSSPTDPRARGVVEILVRYVSRMAARATPFGLFSGCSMGTIGQRTVLELEPRTAYRRHTRLDTLYLATLCEALRKDPSIRAHLSFRPSSGLYEAAGHVRYAEAHTNPETRALRYELMSVEKSAHLDAALERAAHGARLEEIAKAVMDRDADVPLEDARAFVDELVESQILESDLAPPITGEEQLRGVLRVLGDATAGDTTTNEATKILTHVDDAIHALDANGLGVDSSRYLTIAESLAPLPAKADLARLFQVDLYKPVARAELGPEIVRELRVAASVLARVARPPQDREGLDRFRDALVNRYSERLAGPLSVASTIPLVEVLDEEAGVGFRWPFEAREPTPLLEGVAIGASGSPSLPFSRREHFLLRKIAEAERTGSREWKMTDDDVNALGPKPAELPHALAMIATLIAESEEDIKRGDFRLSLQAITGPSGALLLGRFCHGDPALRRAVEDHLRAEEAEHPDAIYAEVVHLPEGRLGNVLCRPQLRAYEIAYHGRTGAPEDHRIPITDLRVGLANDGRIALYSTRHRREVMPRLTSAHFYERAELGVYRFLCSLQKQTHAYGFWSWGALNEAPFLPRVTCGRVIVAPAQWTVMRDRLEPIVKGSPAEKYRAAQALRRELRLPRWIAVADADNMLPVDLDNVLHLESFAQLVKPREGVSLKELFVDEGLLARGPEGRFVHEIVVPFIAKRETKHAPIREAPTPKSATRRTFTPGSEWLYAKIYTGTAGADDVLKAIAPWIARARGEGADRWFFVRFGDPEWHVRVRLHADAKALASTWLPSLSETIAPLIADGRVWKMSLDTYEREVGRYGGPDAIALAEAIFQADSDASIALLDLLEDEEGDERWHVTLRGLHVLLVDLGFNLESRIETLRVLRARFGEEHAVDVYVEKQLGQKFRAARSALEAILAASPGAGHPLDPGLEVIARRSEIIVPIAGELRALADEGRLALSLPEIAGSLMHMHANRMLRAEHRAQELVLYDFLLRLYESEAARARRGPRT